MTTRLISTVAATFCLLSICGATYTIWNTWWLLASVEAMTADMERDGIIDAARAADLRDTGSHTYSGTGSYLMQGRDRGVLIGLYALSTVSIIGFGVCAAIALAKRASRVSSSPPAS